MLDINKKLSKTETLNQPNWRRFTLQGVDRFLVKVHRETEKKTSGGIFVPVKCTTIPSTGTVVALSPMSPECEAKYSVKVGDNIQVVPNAWTTLEIDGELMATGILDYVVATYDFPEAEESLAKIEAQTEDDQRAALDRMKVEATTFTGEPKPVPSSIRVK